MTGASAAAIRSHYDISNDFYRLWLDPTMTYSCALWEPSDDLEGAQRRKIAYFLDALGVGPGTRLLDIGCGWGAALSAASARGAEAFGITLSGQQAAHCATIAGIDVEYRAWQDLHPARTFDAILSVGAFEHFARRSDTPRDRLRGYVSFFERCYELLQPGGRLCLQTIARDQASIDDEGPVAAFFYDRVFPESALPSLREVIEALEPTFRVIALRVDGDHYARTCREWMLRLREHRADAVGVAGDDVYRHYERYLALSELMFRRSECTLYRFTLERRDAPLR